MTSKEMESRSGVPRANIRYYEAEGCSPRPGGATATGITARRTCAPWRRSSSCGGWGCPSRSSGPGGGEGGPDRRPGPAAGGAERRAGVAGTVQRVCGDLRRSGATFASLAPGRYLADLDAPALPGEAGAALWKSAPAPSLPQSDRLPTVSNPVRRLVARSIDEALYLLAFLIPLALSSYGLDAGSEFFAFWLSKLLELLAEPLLLRLFGTTPGKAIMGLRLSRADGGKLSVKQGMSAWWGSTSARSCWLFPGWDGSCCTNV